MAEKISTPTFKVIELGVVTDESIETVLNEWVPKGWHLETIQFVKNDSSRRPAMAFVIFYRDTGE